MSIILVRWGKFVEREILMNRKLLLFGFFLLTATLCLFGRGRNQDSVDRSAWETVTAFSAFSPLPGISGINTYADHLAWQAVERELLVNIDFQTVPGGEWVRRLEILMASGDLPDFFLRINPRLAEQYGRQGVLMPLNNLINTEIPNLRQIMNQHRSVAGAMTSAEGNIYFFPRLLIDPRLRHDSGIIIREDWVRSLGLPMPSTTDQFYNVLKAFKEGNFNRGGNRNEAPFVGDYRFLIWAFGIGSRGINQENDFFVEDRQLKYGPTDPRYRAALEYLHMLYSDGLIENSSDETYMQKLVGESAGATFGSWAGVLSPYNRLLEAEGKNPGFRGIIPLAGPTGERNSHGNHNELDLDFGGAISSTTSKIDTVARIFDYLYSTEGSVVMSFGIEGDTFILMNGEPRWTSKVLDSSLSFQNYRRAFISDVGTIPHQFNVMGYMENLTPFGIEANRINAESSALNKKPPSLRFSEAELRELQTLEQQLNAFVDDNLDGFISGRQPLSQWNVFQQGLQQLGVIRLVELYNTSFRRFLAASN